MNARRLFEGFCLSVLCLAAASPVFGLANRVFVSARSGNDANSCDNVNTPCQTLAGAVFQVNPGGEAIVLDSGGYGPVTISKALTIEAPPGVLALIHPPSGDAITINAGGSDTIVLRGLVLNGGGGNGNGLTVNTVGILQVESCVINGFTGNTAETGNGLYFAASGRLFLSDTTVRNCAGTGVVVLSTAVASLDRVNLTHNSYGLVCTGRATIGSSLVSGNSLDGVLSELGELNLEKCLITNNGDGVAASGIGASMGVVRVSNSTITDNVTGLAQLDGSLLSRGNNTVEGNGTDGSFTGTYSAK